MRWKCCCDPDGSQHSAICHWKFQETALNQWGWHQLDQKPPQSDGWTALRSPPSSGQLGNVTSLGLLSFPISHSSRPYTYAGKSILKMIHRQHMFLSQFCFLMGPQKRPHGELWSKHIKSTKQTLPAIDFLCVCYLEASLRFSLLSAADWFSVSLVFVIVATGQAENEKWSWKCQMAQGGDLETASASWLGITSLLGIWG